MANLALVRIDSRLIHGQVVTQWIKNAGANRIIIIDDQIAADLFMAQVFIMAAPPKVKLDILSTDAAGEQWKKDEFGSGTVMVLIKDVATMKKAYQKGFEFPMLQLGGIGSAPGRVAVVGPITLDEADARVLNDLDQRGCKIVFQITPNTAVVTWKTVKNKYFPNL